METLNIPSNRLVNQQLEQTRFQTPAEVVGWMGAVQAQEYHGAKWALALRLPNATDDAIEQPFTDGAILRTHLLRPTWHFVTVADIRWLLELTGPRILAGDAGNRRDLELDDSTLGLARDTLIKTMQGGKYLTRSEIADALAQAGIEAKGRRLAHLVFWAELVGVLCSGPRRGKQFTYALLEERVPPSPTLDRDAAVVELTRRYFISHGPATIQDFGWWSGLTQVDIKAALETLKAQLVQETFNGKTYWFPADQAAPAVHKPAFPAYLLPPYDEYTVAYKDRSDILDPQFGAEAKWEILSGAMVIDCQAVGTWKRTLGKASVTIELKPFRPLTPAEQAAFASAAQRYGEFLGLPVELA